MRHFGHILVLCYAGAIGILQYGFAAANSTGLAQSGPWVLACVVAFLLALAASIKVFRSVLDQWSGGTSDEISLSEFDVPDHVFFGTFTAFVAVNFVAHFVLAAESDVGGTVWFLMWIVADLLVGLLSFVIFKVTMKRRLNQVPGRGPRPVRDRDAA